MFRRTLSGLLMLLFSGTTAFADKVVIKGSNTFGEYLGPVLIAEFRRDNPRVEFEIETKGTGSGIAAVIAGECDLGAASRVISQDEWRLARSRGLRLDSHSVGYYGVAVIVNAGSPLRSLTDTQIRDLFTGGVADWTAVSGGAGPVQLYIRDKVSGTHVGFQELAMGNQAYPAGARPFLRDEEIAGAVAADRNGIGYVAMHLVKAAGVRAVAVNGIAPTPVAINEGLYPFARLVHLYSNRARISPGTRQFLRFIQSRRGQQVVEQHGYVPVMGRRLDPLQGTFN